MPPKPSPSSPEDPLRGILAKSHQAGRPTEELTDHLMDAFHGVQALRHRIGRINVAERALDGRFWPVAALAALTHDAGKIPPGFQEMVHGRTRSWGERHEVLSLGFLPPLVPDDRLLTWVAEAVLTHHRPLTAQQPGRKQPIRSLYGGSDLAELRSRFGKVDPVVAARLAAWLAATGGHLLAPGPTAAGQFVTASDITGAVRQTTGEPVDVVAQAHAVLTAVLDRWRRRSAPDDEGLVAVLLQGAVTLADHLSSSHGMLHPEQPIGSRFPALLRDRFNAQGGRLRPHQIEAGAVRGHLLLRAPTGSGKTEAGLLWAAQQVAELIADKRGIPRVFHTLPYLASINVMADRLGDLLGDRGLVGVSHSRAASYHLANAIEDEPAPEELGQQAASLTRAARKAVSRAAATRLFRETVRVGTPYQLLRGALAGAAHSGILLDSANSVFVLDELHAYDPKRLGFILASASLWERLGGRIAVLSATFPTALGNLVRETLTQPVTLVEAPPGLTKPRHRLLTRPHHLTDDAALDEARELLDAERSVLVVANNVAHALHLFEQLAPEAVRQHGDGSALLLHSRFKRQDRKRIENRIMERYGTTRTREDRRSPGLVVATQVVEVSLDVDFDVLLTAGAPLEALLQRFGRINRVAFRPPAEVIVHQPGIGTRRRGAEEYADGVYPAAPTLTSMQIIVRHEGQQVDEEQATAWLDEIYASEWGKDWRQEVTRWCSEFTEQFLSFTHPFDDRSHLAGAFDDLFDGTEAVFHADLPAYEAMLVGAADHPSGRLLAAEYLLPLPGWATGLASYDRRLGIAVIDGDYDPDRGLAALRGVGADRYQPGEVI
ncbi:CRISPR-associated helicase Cas3' [Plantactinospora sp. WMMC1484]|uniref:CRISPR-associated helicase Cas3' n=1 Tax=Plantactinospora sp. WMMC1484 TaxID=3404122 RepID=UPI003BF58D87